MPVVDALLCFAFIKNRVESFKFLFGKPQSGPTVLLVSLLGNLLGRGVSHWGSTPSRSFPHTGPELHVSTRGAHFLDHNGLIQIYAAPQLYGPAPGAGGKHRPVLALGRRNGMLDQPRMACKTVWVGMGAILPGGHGHCAEYEGQTEGRRENVEGDLWRTVGEVA